MKFILNEKFILDERFILTEADEKGSIGSLKKDIIPNYDIETFTIKQFRRHNRQLIHRQTERY